MSDIAHASALELAGMIKKREISSVDVTRHYIDRIERLDGDVNAVVVRIFERALEDASTADEQLTKGNTNGPLHGVPMTIKESYVIKDTPSTYGHAQFKNNIGKADGLAVSRFRAAGAHFLGKTNVPVDLSDFQSYNPLYGTTGNPWDTERTPGGSSGGSAAALAAGFTGLEAGSDIGGSIRNPAHFCGVYGHKPTWGIVPMQGHELVEKGPETDLAVCGPLARSAADLHVALDTMAGPAPRESAGWQLNLPEAGFDSLKGLRVAIWQNDEIAPVDNEVADRADMVARVLDGLGAKVSDTARPAFDVKRAHVAYLSLLNSVMAAGQTDEDVARNQEYAAEFARDDMSDQAATSRGMVLSHRHWLHQNALREHWRFAWDDFFKNWDVLVCPQMATPAFPHDHSPFNSRTIQVNNEQQPYFKQLFWSGLITSAYLPSTVFPTGPSQAGLPIGLQAISAPYHDHWTIEFTRLLAAEIGGFQAPPAFT